MNNNRSWFWGLVGLVGMLLFLGCGGYGSPSDVAERYLAAMQVGDYRGAQALASEDSQALLEALAKGNPPIGDHLVDIEVGTYKVSGDRAAVEYTVDGEPHVLGLVKESEEWKAIFEPLGGHVGLSQPTTVKETEARRAAVDFLVALYSGDKQTALDLSTWDSHPEIELLDYDYKREKPDAIDILDVTENGETGTVHYTRNGKSFYQDLVLTGQGWKVKFDRTDEEVFEDLQRGLDQM